MPYGVIDFYSEQYGYRKNMFLQIFLLRKLLEVIQYFTVDVYEYTIYFSYVYHVFSFCTMN